MTELLNVIIRAFSDVALGDGYTLLEEDFFDSGGVRCHFDQLGLDASHVLIGGNFSVKLSDIRQGIINLVLWPVSSREIALEALSKREKAVNPFISWQDITYEYLDAHRAVSFLSPTAFRYYLPAAMTIFLDCINNNEDIDFFSGFDYALIGRPNNYINVFSDKQCHAIACFLEYYSTSLNIFSSQEEITCVANLFRSRSGVVR